MDTLSTTPTLKDLVPSQNNSAPISLIPQGNDGLLSPAPTDLSSGGLLPLVQSSVSPKPASSPISLIPSGNDGLLSPSPTDLSSGGLLPSGGLRPLINPHQMQEDSLQQRINSYEMPDPGKPGFFHALGRVASRIGNIAGDIVAPSTMMLIPGTDLNRAMEHNSNVREQALMQQQDIAQQGAADQHNQALATTAKTQAEAGLEQQALAHPENWSEPVATDQGYVRINKLTNEIVPVTYNGKTLMPYVKPLTDESTQPLSNGPAYQAAMADRWHQLNPGKPMPPQYILPSNATVGDYTRINSALTSLEQAAYQQQVHQDSQANAAATRDAAASARAAAAGNQEEAGLDRISTRIIKPYQDDLKAGQSKFDSIDQAMHDIDSGYVGQALGLPGLMKAVVSGQGSGIRITQAELNSIFAHRGIKGDVNSYINSLNGKGSWTAADKANVRAILSDARDRLMTKQQITNDTIDRINGAGSRADVVQADKDARQRFMDVESYKQFATMPNGQRIGSKDGDKWFDLRTGEEAK